MALNLAVRRSLLLLAAGWIAGAVPAAAQEAAPRERPRLSPEQRAQMRQWRAELSEHVGVARSAVAARNGAAATEAIERAQTLVLNMQQARAGAAGAPPPQGGRGARLRAALDQARAAVGRRDFAAADNALRPVAERLSQGARR